MSIKRAVLIALIGQVFSLVIWALYLAGMPWSQYLSAVQTLADHGGLLLFLAAIYVRQKPAGGPAS